MTVILGINAYHGDSSACLVMDGQLIAAAEEERFRRIKHWAGFPSEAIRYCLKEAGIGLGDVQHAAVNSDPRASLGRKLLYTVAHRPDPRLILDRLRNARRRASTEAELEAIFPGQRFGGEVHRIEHHLAHLASCFLVSPFDEAVAVSVDGFGDFSSAAWGTGAGGELSVQGRVHFPHSLGIFYQAMTQYLGFPHYGDEYKVMGLAPYGEPRHVDQMRRLVQLQEDGTFRLGLEYFRHHKENIDYTWAGGVPVVGQLFSQALVDLLGPARGQGEPLEDRHRDIARSIQAMYEEAFFRLINALHRHTGLTHLTLAGGCAMNSVANGKVRRNTPFDHVYVQSAAGDAGGAIGAAFVVSGRLAARRHGARFRMDHAYWGPHFSSAEVGEVLGVRNAEAQGRENSEGGDRTEDSGLRTEADGSEGSAANQGEEQGTQDGEGEETIEDWGLRIGADGTEESGVRGERHATAPDSGDLGLTAGDAGRSGRSEALRRQGCTVEQVEDEGELCRLTAKAVAEGKVVGWFQGRMEWGPRALGNRSIVCDPRRPDMKNILNLKIKRRESFRPFAPSILREAVAEWFETDDDVPFMMKVFQIREEKRQQIPAVTHVDGSGRLQTVRRDTNPRYYRLIEAFRDLTGVPVVLNTSFNENEPVVCRPEEALDCFLRTKMDLLVMEDWVVSRNP